MASHFRRLQKTSDTRVPRLKISPKCRCSLGFALDPLAGFIGRFTAGTCGRSRKGRLKDRGKGGWMGKEWERKRNRDRWRKGERIGGRNEGRGRGKGRPLYLAPSSKILDAPLCVYAPIVYVRQCCCCCCCCK